MSQRFIITNSENHSSKRKQTWRQWLETWDVQQYNLGEKKASNRIASVRENKFVPLKTKETT